MIPKRGEILMKKTALQLKKGDILLIIAVVILCIVLFLSGVLSSRAGTVAKVYADGEIVKTIELNAVAEEYNFSVGEVEFNVSKGEISFLSSDCRDGLCVSYGRLTRAGEVMACVPNRVVVVLSAQNSKQPHAVTY